MTHFLNRPEVQVDTPQLAYEPTTQDLEEMEQFLSGGIGDPHWDLDEIDPSGGYEYDPNDTPDDGGYEDCYDGVIEDQPEWGV